MGCCEIISYIPPVRQVRRSVVSSIEAISANERHGIGKDGAARRDVDAESAARHGRLRLLSYDCDQ